MITQDFPPETGGIQTYSISHAKNLAEKCEWFGVVCPNKKNTESIDQNLRFPVFRLKARNDLLVFSLLTHLRPILSRYRVEAVFHSQWQTAAASLRAKKKGLVSKVFAAAHIRELLFNPFDSVPVLDRLFIKYRNSVLNQIDHFYPVSDYTAEALTGLGVDSSKITVVINGTDPDQFYPADASDIRKRLGLENKKILLTITRLVPRKGIDTVIQAFEKVCREIPDAHYLVIGDGDDKARLEELVKKHELNEMVTFTGRIPYSGLNNYYNAGDIFVMPSRTQYPDIEGFGIVFLEANSCGLPVIGSDSGGIPSAIKDGQTGYIIPEGDAEALADKIISLFNDPDLSYAIGKKGREWVLQEANWGVVSEKLFEDIRVRIGH